MVILALPAQVRSPPQPHSQSSGPTALKPLRPQRKPRKTSNSNSKVVALKELRLPDQKEAKEGQKPVTVTRIVHIRVEDPDATDDGSTDEDNGAVNKRRKVKTFKASAAYDKEKVPKRVNEKVRLRSGSAVLIDIPGPVPDMEKIMLRASDLLFHFFDDLPDG